jgi:hypothetical protein
VQDRVVLADHRGREHRLVPGEGADAQVITGDPDVVQFGQIVDVDDAFGLGDPQPHHRDEAVPAGDQPGLAVVLVEQVQRLLDAVRPGVVHGGGCLHARFPSAGDGVRSAGVRVDS